MLSYWINVVFFIYIVYLIMYGLLMSVIYWFNIFFCVYGLRGIWELEIYEILKFSYLVLINYMVNEGFILYVYSKKNIYIWRKVI